MSILHHVLGCSDVVFIVGSDKEQIFAHKVQFRSRFLECHRPLLCARVQFILAAASEVFAAMVYPNPAFKDLKPASQQITVDIGALTPLSVLLACMADR